MKTTPSLSIHQVLMPWQQHLIHSNVEKQKISMKMAFLQFSSTTFLNLFSFQTGFRGHVSYSKEWKYAFYKSSLLKVVQFQNDGQTSIDFRNSFNSHLL